MFGRMIVAAALVFTAGAALASDVSYDQQQIREGKVTAVEGRLGPAAPRPAAQAEKAPASEHTRDAKPCSCSR